MTPPCDVKKSVPSASETSILPINLLTVRAENTKNRRSRVVPYSPTTDRLYQAYLIRRRTISRAKGNLFLSESRRNYGDPITRATWSKVIQRVSTQAEVDRFSTHTLRHLRLTDLARDGWDLHEIATFAGHRSLETTLQYIHLSGRDLAEKVRAGMETVHAWRLRQIDAAFQEEE